MPKTNRAVIIWLIAVCLTVFCMVVVGGITRLTESGLSMVNWHPLVGIVPPMTELEWQAEFDTYKAFPQYQKVNTGMSLDEFKNIFYWEYGHRVLGRLVGVVFLVPFIVLFITGKIGKPLVPKLVVGLALGGLQGLMGWYMVKSGLVDIPRVSHYRLAAHLLLALLILGYLSWLVFSLWQGKLVKVQQGFRNMTYLFMFVLVLQLLYGALVAGSRAGYGYNTFPLMNGDFIPSLAFQHNPFWMNFLDNNAMLQFLHRWIGALVLLMAAMLYYLSRPEVRFVTLTLLLAILAQFLLGVVTLINVVPISLASIHQAGACIVLVMTIFLLYVTQAGHRIENIDP